MAKNKNRQYKPLEESKSSRALFLLFAILFRVLLDFSFIELVSTVFEYEGFMLDMQPDKYLASWILFVLIAIYLPKNLGRPSDCLILIAFFSVITPILALFGLQNQSTWHTVLLLIQFLIVEVVRKYQISQMLSFEKHRKSIHYIVAISIVVVSVLITNFGGAKNFNLDFDRVYEYRADSTVTMYSGIMGYLTVWVTNIFGGYLVILVLKQRRWAVLFLVLILHVAWYGATSHKSIVFYPLLVVASYAMFRKSRYLFTIPLILTLVVAASLINYKVTQDIFTSSMFIRRAFFIPSFMVYTYYNFFSENTLLFWSNSFLNGIVKYSYDRNINLVIGQHLGQDDLWANVSFFATGFMHAGVLGVLFYGVICGLLLSVFDYAFRVGVPMWIVIGLAIVPFHNLFTSSDLGVAVFTHGLGIAIILVLAQKRSQAGGNIEIWTRVGDCRKTFDSEQ